jgi:hypothetical protein
VRNLTISPSEETLVCATSTSQLYNITLSSTDLGKVKYLLTALQGSQYIRWQI